MEEREIKRGDIYHADLNPIFGSEQGGYRPVLIIQNNIGNKYSPTVIVAAITSQLKTKLPTHVPLQGIDGVEKHSVVLLEQVRTIDTRRLDDYVGTLDRETMKRIDKALRSSTGVPKVEEKPLELCLCAVCANIFYDSPEHFIKRADKHQEKKEMCMFCKSRRGYDYLIRKKYYQHKYEKEN